MASTTTSAVSATTTPAVKSFIGTEWDTSIVPVLSKYIEVPNQSPDFDVEWAVNGLQEKAMHLLEDWVKAQNVRGITVSLLEEKLRAPLLHIDIAASPGAATGHVLMYGHMDKQPPVLPWAEGLDPYTPVIREGKLYGRGAASGGYAICGAIASILALQKAGIPHAHTTILIESGQESGSTDLMYWVNKIKPSFGAVDLVICLDGGAATYNRLWLTSALRGVTSAMLKVEVLNEPIHSGMGGGVVPDPHRILRQLMDRIECSKTGQLNIKSSHVEILDSMVRDLEGVNLMPRGEFLSQFPLLPGVSLFPERDNLEDTLRLMWRPSLAITGYESWPAVNTAGNVIRSSASMRMSISLPPGASVEKVEQELKELLEREPPYGSKVHCSIQPGSKGWSAPMLAPWLNESLQAASRTTFGNDFGIWAAASRFPSCRS